MSIDMSKLDSFILPDEEAEHESAESLVCPHCNQRQIASIILLNETIEVNDVPGTVEIPVYVCCLRCGFQQRLLSRYLNTLPEETGEQGDG